MNYAHNYLILLILSMALANQIITCSICDLPITQDYQIDSVAIRERQHKGKFAGSAKGFKMETAIQLIDNLDVRVFSTTEIKEQVKRNPIPIAFEDTGLKKYQENAFVNAYVYIMKKTYRSDEM